MQLLQTCDTITPMSDTPQHVQDFNAANGAERYGGLHFDDPAYDGDTAPQTEHYTAEVKQSEAKTPEHADLAAWLRKQTWSDFAQSLAGFHADRGYLTPKQVASATSMRTKVEARQDERDTNKGATSDIDLSELPSGYYAVPGGDTRLKVRVNHVTKGKWDGFTFVDDGAEYGSQQKYGMQRPDGKYKGKIEDQLRTIVADPQAAGRAYAAITTRCYRCNLKLEDETSVELGIGPICRNK